MPFDVGVKKGVLRPLLVNELLCGNANLGLFLKLSGIAAGFGAVFGLGGGNGLGGASVGDLTGEEEAGFVGLVGLVGTGDEAAAAVVV